MPPLYAELPLSAQASYSELYEMALAAGMSPLATLHGSFHWRTLKGQQYAYFGFRDTDGKGRMAYVGPDNERVRALVDQFASAAENKGRQELIRNRAQATIALGCVPMLPKHFRIVQKLASYGFFRAGGVLIGTHAFVSMGNMLGVRWGAGDKTLDIDFARAGKNISIALPADADLSVHDALTSLEMGLLPIREFSGKVGAQYRNPDDPELRIDFVTAATGSAEPTSMPSLGIALEPLKFMEFSLEGTTEGVALADGGACVVNLPDPARYAVHKLIVSGERPVSQQAKSNKDLEQASALVQWHVKNERADRLRDAWDDAIARGPGWTRRAMQGRKLLAAKYPELARALR